MIFSLLCIKVNAATVGQQLLNPDAGWQRIDNTNPAFTYSAGFVNFSYGNYYGGSVKYTYGSNESIKFNFTGNKLRIISTTNSSFSTAVDVYIDGTKASTISVNGSPIIYQYLAFDVSNLENKEHYVEIKTVLDKEFELDAIDIDSNGQIKTYTPIVATEVPSNLVAIPGNLQISLSWTVSTGATSYNIKRSTTVGGPYSTIGASTASTYTDTTVTNGTKYYYVVTAVGVGGESKNSNEVIATPLAYQGNRAVLEITMTSGTIKEYDLSTAQIDAFLQWIDDKQNGAPGTKSYFAINVSNKVKPFISRKEYIMFSKIDSFEIKDYND